MPGMSGPELAERLAPERPDEVLYTSGYTDDAMVARESLNAGVAFLQKPFVPDTLTRKVRNAGRSRLLLILPSKSGSVHACAAGEPTGPDRGAVGSE